MKETTKSRLKGIGSFILMLGALNFFVGLFFFSWCMFTGRIDRKKLVLVGEVFRGRLTDAPPAPIYVTSDEERDAIRENIRAGLILELTTRQREAESMLSRASQIRADMEAERAKTGAAVRELASERARFEKEVADEKARRLSVEFAQNVKWLSTIDAAAGARMLAELPMPDVLRYLRSLKDRTATDLIVALALEYERRDAVDGSDLTIQFHKAVGLPADTAAIAVPAPTIPR